MAAASSSIIVGGGIPWRYHLRHEPRLHLIADGLRNRLDPAMRESPILRVEALSVDAVRPGATRTIVDQLSFCVGVERVALVGESGSGKSLTARPWPDCWRPPAEARCSPST